MAQTLSNRPKSDEFSYELTGRISIASALRTKGVRRVTSLVHRLKLDGSKAFMWRGQFEIAGARSVAMSLVFVLAILASLASPMSWAQSAPTSADNDKAGPDPVVLALNRAREFRAKGEFNEALRLVDKALETTPRDLQLRFMRGLIFTDQARSDNTKTDEAISVFEALTQDYPEVGEPHNNLAVLLAGKGELEKARYALERAILAQPNYSLAYENLGDIYLRLAEKAYGEASVKNPASKTAKAKLDQAKGWVKAVEK